MYYFIKKKSQIVFPILVITLIALIQLTLIGKANNTSCNMVLVEPGNTTFENGNISLDYDIYVGIYLVTFAEYDQFVNDTGARKPSDQGWGRGDRPVINIGRHEAIEYANWLSKNEGLAPAYDLNHELIDVPANVEGYRLPTSTEWEFVARGGVEGEATIYAGSNNLDEVGWYFDNSEGKTQVVGLKKPNEFGIYDMSGNVWEWTNCIEDNFGYHISRGGTWNAHSFFSKITEKRISHPSSPFISKEGNRYLGFRLVRTK